MATSLITVLHADTDQQLIRALSTHLAAEGYRPIPAHTAAQVLHAAAAHKLGLILLDLALSDTDPIDVITSVRGWSSVPIITLGAHTETRHRVRALDTGADDYVDKPFDTDELLARIRAGLRRAAATKPSQPAILRTAAFTIDLAAKRVQRDGIHIHLTPTEWNFLEVLARNRGCLITQRELLQRLWGPAHHTRTNYLRVYLNLLRRKLEPDPAHPRHLITEAGIGYRLEP